MARKLKSDKLLFLATLLLVLASIVMVYSASAVMAMERYNRPYLFLIKQGMWAALGLALLGIVMRVDYRTWKQPLLIWSGLATVGLALLAVLFMGPINGTRRWFGLGGFGVQPSELAKLAAIFFTAALLERRMHRIDEVKLLAAADRTGGRGIDRAGPDRAGLRHRVLDCRRGRADGLRGRPEPEVPPLLRAHRRAAGRLGAHQRRVPARSG